MNNPKSLSELVEGKVYSFDDLLNMAEFCYDDGRMPGLVFIDKNTAIQTRDFTEIERLDDREVTAKYRREEGE